MTKYERLLQYAYDDEVNVIEDSALPGGYNGLYIRLDRQPTIFLRKWLSTDEKTCVLAEEIGHHQLTCRDRRFAKKPEISKEEYLARGRAVEIILSWQELKDALKQSRFCLYTCADILSVTYPFLLFAIAHYDKKYPEEMTTLRRAALSRSAAI